MKSLHIALVGCGIMGRSLLDRWLEVFPALTVMVLEVRDMPPMARVEHFQEVSTFCTALSRADVLILAIKPQDTPNVCRSLALPLGLPVVSLAAGVSLKSLTTWLGGSDRLIVRGMPNLAAKIGLGVTALAGADVPLVRDIFAAVGHVEWLKDETLFDAITALAGSGPAYIFYLTEVLAACGEKYLGLPCDMATRLARATVAGAGAFMTTRTVESASDLRKTVTSTGGTTQAALEILMDGRMETLFGEALIAAADRSRALRG